MAYETIKTEVDGNVGILTLNRPDSLNAWNTQMRADFRAAAAELEADPEVRCIVLTGEGRAFSAGADLKETAGIRDTTVERVLVEEYKPCVLAITNSNKPWIAAVSGPASGIGAGNVEIAQDGVVQAGRRTGVPQDLLRHHFRVAVWVDGRETRGLVDRERVRDAVSRRGR